ncbi:MAG: transcriptional repressor, CopY family [Solirubrobacterales bacterium]|jgi:predicted transcriptional regulator|nr:transcriptional repressor, CopY family [Solirubrobacterales bacterium]
MHELETEVMQELWERQVSSVREIMEALNARAPRPRAYTTYLTIMTRLEGKGLLDRAREGRTDFYRPLYTRDRYTELRAHAEVDSVVEQFGEVALGHFARQMAELDPQRRRTLQRLARKK